MCTGTSNPTSITSCSAAVQTNSTGTRLPRIEVPIMQETKRKQQCHAYRCAAHVASTAGSDYHPRQVHDPVAVRDDQRGRELDPMCVSVRASRGCSWVAYKLTQREAFMTSIEAHSLLYMHSRTTRATTPRALALWCVPAVSFKAPNTERSIHAADGRRQLV